MSGGSEETSTSNEIIIDEQTDSQEHKTQQIGGFTSIDEFTKDGFRLLVEGTRVSNSLINATDRDLYASSSTSLQRDMNTEGRRLLQLMAMVFQHQEIPGNIVRRPLDDKLDLITDANDIILERVNIHLDELDGIRKNPEPILFEAAGTTTKVVSGSWNKQSNNLTLPARENSFNPHKVRLLTAKNIERPQVKFKDKIDNSKTPFEPRIKDKPNSLKPLAILVEQTLSGESFSHPYDYELDRFVAPPAQLAKVEPAMIKPLVETPLIEISQPDQLAGLVKDLLRYEEIAVDLEHHSYRTYQGITCLMQISTRDTDYIIDTLVLRDKLHCLNEVFTKPSIVKIFHGAENDIVWLQRDLCLYVVNMFDTYQASKLLNHSRLSLAYLLKLYCRVDVNKHFQLADWRLRPLPQELKNYAREDTHYLIYIYQVLKNALLDAAAETDRLLNATIHRGVQICKKRYEKPLCTEESYLNLYRRNAKLFDNRQLFALKEIYNWRDSTAREQDESTGYVLPNHMLLQMSETLPREMQGILACCNPIPPLVRQYLAALHQIVLKAREQPLIKIIEENRTSATNQTRAVKKNVESSMNCPHDLTRVSDFRDDLPTLLSSNENTNGVHKKLELDVIKLKIKDSPSLSLFVNGAESSIGPALDLLKQAGFVSPYDRCKSVQPFMLAEEEAALAANKTTEKSVITSDVVNTPDQDQERVDRIKDHFMKESKRLEEDTLRNQLGKSKRHGDHGTEEVNPPPEPPKKKKRKKDKQNKQKQQLSDTKEIIQQQIMSPVKVKIEKDVDQVPEKFQPFDYKNVDFNRFKGGSQQIEQKVAKKKNNKNKGKGKKFSGKSNCKTSFRGGLNGPKW